MAIRDDFTAGEVLAAADLNDTFGAKANLLVDLEAKTADYTLALADAGKLITVDSSSAETVTIPTNATTPFPVGTVIAVAQLGAGVVDVNGAAGVTIISTAGANPSLTNQYAGAQCYKIATNTWLVIGSID